MGPERVDMGRRQPYYGGLHERNEMQNRTSANMYGMLSGMRHPCEPDIFYDNRP